MYGQRATSPAALVSQGAPSLPGPASLRLCNRGALPLARATGKSAGVRGGGGGEEAAAGRRVGGGCEEQGGTGGRLGELRGVRGHEA